MRDAIAEFQDFNRAFARRDPELLRLKIARMAAGPFAFFRGTFHLFAKDILNKVFDTDAGNGTGGPELDLVGDIHTENFGTFQADDGIHYDINDFDETTRGRFDFDIRRLATSCVLAALDCGRSLGDAAAVAIALLESYAETVSRAHKKGRLLDLGVSEASPSNCAALDRLVRTAAAVKRPAFMDKLTEVSHGKRQLRRSAHYFNLPEAERAQALRLLDDYRQRMSPPASADFYQVEDVCGRIAGVGSMGRLRYAVLVVGKGSAEGRNVLFEFKEARPSGYDLARDRDKDAEALAKRGERVIAVQRASQAASNPRLGFAVDGGISFQVRELGPHDMRLDFKEVQNAGDLQAVVRVMAGILARTHARAIARMVGVANPLADLAQPLAFNQRMLAFALAYAELTQRDWQRFAGQRSELEKCEQWAGK